MYHNKVNLSLTPVQRLGNHACNCKTDYLNHVWVDLGLKTLSVKSLQWNKRGLIFIMEEFKSKDYAFEGKWLRRKGLQICEKSLKVCLKARV